METENIKKGFHLIDLTHTLREGVPAWDIHCGFALSTRVDYKDCHAPNLSRVQQVVMGAGIGTHMDVPAHCFPGGRTVEQMSLEELVTDCVVIRVDQEADEHYLAMPSVVESFEKEHGKIQPNTFVIFYTGWDKYWNTPEKYRNNLLFPSVHESTAKILLERNIAGLGIDTLSSDATGRDFPVHRAILGAGKYLVENIANAKDLPAMGSKSIALPIKIKEGTEAPIRLIALV